MLYNVERLITIVMCCLIASESGAQDTLRKAMPLQPAMTEDWTPVADVTPGWFTNPPSDAIVLFDGNNTSEWISRKDSTTISWKIVDRALRVSRGGGHIVTRKLFGDCQLHIEWRVPQEHYSNPMKKGNSGILFQDRYEIQILDSYKHNTYTNAIAGSVYKQARPLVNPARRPNEWNVFDIIYTAPRFNESGSLFSPARVTLLYNGVLVQNNTEIAGSTTYSGLPVYTHHGKASLQLQDHDSAVEFRNIWIREL